MIFTQYCLGQHQTKYSVQEVKADFEYLYKTLDASHYNLYTNTKKEVFDNEYKRISESITDSLTVLQIDRLFHKFVALVKDGHCTLPDPPISSYESFLQSGGTVFPLNVYFKNQKIFVLDNYSADSSIVPGDEIISINGKPINDKLKDIYDYLCADNGYSKNASIEAYTFPRIFWIVNGEFKNYNVDFKKQNGKQININLSSISANEYEGKLAQKKPLMNQTRNFHLIDDIAYLKPGIFYNTPKDGNIQINSTLLDNKEFTHFLDSCFTIIHNNKTRDLIIDLRDNPGGSATFSNPMVAFFATEPFTVGAKFLIRTSEISKNFWKEMNDTSQLFVDIKKEIISRENGSRFELSAAKYKYQPRNDSLKYKGNVYVLINRFSFSQAIEVPGMIKKYGFGKLIGEQTSPLMSANARQFKLPNTQMSVYYSEAYYGDSSFVNGVIPDYLISDDLLTEKDEILDYTLQLIKKNQD
jgi:C-terminal processing protease CtpA/Prc